ncbi:MAG: 7-cyano-7-deazaguanine synthase QueC [Acidobacteriota bacterium]
MSEDPRPAVVLLSGGMDSAVAAAMTRRRGAIACLHFSYGQRTAARERRAFEAIAATLGAVHARVLRLEHLGALGDSALTDSRLAIPAAQLDRREIPPTYVPFRNAQFLAAAVAWAEVLGARVLVYGAVEEDSSGYPDCRETFVQAFNRLIEVGSRAGAALRVEAPLLHRRKSEIVRLGLEFGAPFHLTWSCYQDQEVACGACDSCVLRRRGFHQAGVEDPLPYPQP